MDENQQNEGEETPVEETKEVTQEEVPQEEKETPKEKTEHTDSEKRLYARLKEAEDAAKKAKADLAKKEQEFAKAKLPISDVDAILEVQSSTRDLDSEEVSELKLRASSLGVSLSEAREDKNYQVWKKAYREGVEKENALKPSSKQDEMDKPKSFSQRLLEARTPEEKGKILDEAGLNPLNPRNSLSIT